MAGLERAVRTSTLEPALLELVRVRVSQINGCAYCLAMHNWAAKGTALLGVRAVIAASYERIHRSNLIGMGVLPLQFSPGSSADSLGFTGEEAFTIRGLAGAADLPRTVTVSAEGPGDTRQFAATVRIDAPGEADYYRHGGILPYVLRSLAAR